MIGDVMRRVFALVLSLVLILGVVALPQPVYAATQTLAADGEGSETEGSYLGGATYAVINSDDGDTSTWDSAINVVNTADYHSWNWQDTAIPAGSTINSVTIYLKSRSSPGNGSYKAYVTLGGVKYFSSTKTSPSAYGTSSHTWNTNPATGLAWATAAIDGAEFSVYTYRFGSDQTFHFTYIYIVVDYTAPTAPSVTTSAATSIGYVTGNHTATLNGAITATGGATCDMNGFDYGIASGVYTGNVTNLGSYGVGSFDYTVNTGLVAGTTYYFRAKAHNSVGWGYGSELTFKTLDTPTISTVAATNVASTTARLNSSVTYDGEQTCDVRFAYDNVTHAGGNFTDYATITDWVEDTYTTGHTPYVDITSLTANTTYYFNVQIRNDYDSSEGTELSFTTTTGVGTPSNFVAIPSSTSVSLQWAKGTGSTNTMVRYKLGSYPTSVTDGTQVYLGVESSYQHTGLTSGTTYFYWAVGESGGAYSTGNVTVMATTTAVIEGGIEIPEAPTPSSWWQAPDYTRMSGLPFYGIINWICDAFSMPYATGWFFGYMLFVVALIGAAVYKAGKKLPNALIVDGVLMALGSWMGLVSLWFTVPFVLAAVGIFTVGQRA